MCRGTGGGGVCVCRGARSLSLSSDSPTAARSRRPPRFLFFVGDDWGRAGDPRRYPHMALDAASVEAFRDSSRGHLIACQLGRGVTQTGRERNRISLVCAAPFSTSPPSLASLFFSLKKGWRAAFTAPCAPHPRTQPTLAHKRTPHSHLSTTLTPAPSPSLAADKQHRPLGRGIERSERRASSPPMRAKPKRGVEPVRAPGSGGGSAHHARSRRPGRRSARPRRSLVWQHASPGALTRSPPLPLP